MHPWHNIDINDELKGVVEIPAGSKLKYELDKVSGGLILDRINTIECPYNYGFIPQTLSKDGDPLDVFIVSEDPIYPLTQVKLRVLEIFKLIDNGQEDDKIIAQIENDPKSYTSYDLLKINNIISRYLAEYKKGIELVSVSGKEEAIKAIEEAKKEYSKALCIGFY